jgi:hypothetical protein
MTYIFAEFNGMHMNTSYSTHKTAKHFTWAGMVNSKSVSCKHESCVGKLTWLSDESPNDMTHTG